MSITDSKNYIAIKLSHHQNSSIKINTLNQMDINSWTRTDIYWCLYFINSPFHFERDSTPDVLAFWATNLSITSRFQIPAVHNLSPPVWFLRLIFAFLQWPSQLEQQPPVAYLCFNCISKLVIGFFEQLCTYIDRITHFSLSLASLNSCEL